MKRYDYLLVGSGLYSGVFAWYAKQRGKTCLVLEKRDHIGGNVYCEDVKGIHVHKYGAHIFHTSNRKVWDFVNSLAEFNRYTNSPVANFKSVPAVPAPPLTEIRSASGSFFSSKSSEKPLISASELCVLASVTFGFRIPLRSF